MNRRNFLTGGVLSAIAVALGIKPKPANEVYEHLMNGIARQDPALVETACFPKTIMGIPVYVSEKLPEPMGTITLGDMEHYIGTIWATLPQTATGGFIVPPEFMDKLLAMVEEFECELGIS